MARYQSWVEDDGAPAELEGQRVDLTFSRTTGDGGEPVVTVADRRLIPAAVVKP